MRKALAAAVIIIITVLVTGVILITLNNQTVEAPTNGQNNSQSLSAQTDIPTSEPLAITEMLLPSTSYEEHSDKPYTHVMLHFASDAKANPEDPHNVNAVYSVFEQEEIGAHYYIDRQGQIYRFIDERHKAYHAGSQAGSLPGYPELGSAGNDYAIGIELAGIGTQEEMEIYGIDSSIYSRIPKKAIGYSDAQYQSLKKLLDDIIERHNIVYDRKHIIGHNEYVPELRTDPGELFDWSKIGLD